uniref:hypothetical protein n=1 Tax=Collinsella aerofaciens TaxID=74426 RepID=UPI00359C6F7A
MFAAESYTSRHHIAIVAMACLCVLLGGPSYAAGAESLIIAGATYYEPGVSGPGWSWTDAGHLELDGYAGDAIGAGGDLVVTLVGQNSVTESHAPDADITQCGMEVWGDLTLRGTGSLAASGSQCAIHVSQALAVEGCAVDARADGANVTDEAVAGLIAGGGRVAAVGTAPAAGARAYGVYLQGAGAGVGSAGCTLSVDASWLDATGTDGGVACTSGSLVHACFVTPAGGAIGAGGVVDASGAMAPHVVIEPEDTTAPAGETDDAGEPAGGAGPAVERPGAGSATDPVLKPATAPTKTTTTTETTATRTTAPAPSRAKTASAATVTLPRTADSNWIAASLALLLLGTALVFVNVVIAVLGRPKRKGD